MRLQLTRTALIAAFSLAALAVAAIAPIGTARAQAAPDAPLPPAKTVAPSPSSSAPSSGSGFVSRVSMEIGEYADTDHVFVPTPTVAGSVSKPTEGWSVGGRYLVDVVSAASVDIVSTASRRWEEIRQAGSLDAAYKPGAFGVMASGTASSEPDYTAWSAGGAVMQDFNDKAATWLVGYDHGHDVAGRTGTPFSVFSRTINRDAFKLGLTLVLDHATVLSLAADTVFENGDTSKPYRYVPLFAPGTEVPKGASIDLVTSLRLSDRPLEQLPLSRNRYALSALLAHRFAHSTVRVDERVYTDTWGMKATTTDARLLFDTSRRVELGPHVRLHGQTPVDFWKRAYVLGAGLEFPVLRTGDRELGPLVAVTGGGTLRVGLGSDMDPNAWVLGIDVGLTSTQYLDDLYVVDRISALGALSLEAVF